MEVSFSWRTYSEFVAYILGRCYVVVLDLATPERGSLVKRLHRGVL